jgi:hypothetical protein
MVIITKDLVERRQILDSDKKPLNIYYAKFSTVGPHIFITVKRKGF